VAGAATPTSDRVVLCGVAEFVGDLFFLAYFIAAISGDKVAVITGLVSFLDSIAAVRRLAIGDNTEFVDIPATKLKSYICAKTKSDLNFPIDHRIAEVEVMKPPLPILMVEGRVEIILALEVAPNIHAIGLDIGLVIVAIFNR